MRRVLLSTLVLGPLISWGQAYVVTGLEVGGWSSAATAVNNVGQVVGYRQATVGSRPQAFVWENGRTTWLTVPGSVGTLARDINDAARVVGAAQYTFPDRSAAVAWEGGVAFHLPEPNWPLPRGSEAVTVNRDGQAAGNSWHTVQHPHGGWRTVSRAIAWPREGGFRLADFYDFLSSTVGGSNDHGDIVGQNENRATNELEAFVWRGQTITGFGFGSREHHATGITEAGRVVGWYLWDYDRAFWWQDGSGGDLGLLPGGVGSRAHAINEGGLIVGETIYWGGLTTPCLWRSGQVVALESLIDPRAGWRLLAASDVNDRGQIVGTGVYEGFVRPYLMTPVPEPSGLIGLAVLIAVARRRRP